LAKNVEKNVFELSTSRGVVVMVAFLAFFLSFFCLCGEARATTNLVDCERIEKIS
jgi:hypothetical protein